MTPDEKNRTPATAAFVVEICKIMVEAIREAGPLGLPAGHLYAAMMSKVDIHQYNALEAIILKTGLVKKSGDLLKWAGPAANQPPKP